MVKADLGYLLKNPADETSRRHPSLRAEGYFGLTTAGASRLPALTARRDPYERLTDREKEIFQLVVEGKTNREIGEVLFISPKTVDNHRTHMMEKLGVHSTPELVRFAARRKLLP